MSDFSSYPDPCWFNRLENIKDRNFVRAFLDHDLDRAGRVVADGADPGRINQAWHSELFEMAITAEESEDVRFLVGSGFVPSTDNILCAIDTGCANLFEPVLQTVKDNNETLKMAFRYAVGKSAMTILGKLVPLVSIAEVGSQALSCAIENNHRDVLRWLREQGADIREYDDKALRLATIYHNTIQMRDLIDWGADVHADNDFCLDIALQHDSGHVQLVLLTADPDPDNWPSEMLNRLSDSVREAAFTATIEKKTAHLTPLSEEEAQKPYPGETMSDAALRRSLAADPTGRELYGFPVPPVLLLEPKDGDKTGGCCFDPALGQVMMSARMPKAHRFEAYAEALIFALDEGTKMGEERDGYARALERVNVLGNRVREAMRGHWETVFASKPSRKPSRRTNSPGM